MSRQIRLRLTGYGGSGVCEWMEQDGKYRYRLSVEGEVGGRLEMLLQSRSPYMEKIRSLAVGERFDGWWKTEGETPAWETPVGWLWVLRDDKPWLVGVFPDVTTPTEAARRILMTKDPVTTEDKWQEPLVKIPGLLPNQTQNKPYLFVGGRTCRIRYGGKEQDPFGGRGFYWTAKEESGLWIHWKDP